MMKVDFLFFAGCPSHDDALERLRKVLREEAVDSTIEVREVVDEEEARRFGFVGSPTIRLDGEDIDPQGLQGESPGLSCRIYRLEDGRVSPLPSETLLRQAVRRRAGRG
jgi:hypothetical protein